MTVETFNIVTGEVLDPGSPVTPEEWAEYVTDAHTASVANIVETGRRLNACRQALIPPGRKTSGQWGRVIKLLPFSRRTVYNYISIAAHPELGEVENVQHVAHLPSSWGTLAELARLPEGAIAAGIEAGDITPEMQRSEAQVLVAARLGKPAPHVTHNSGDNEWYTPAVYIEAARAAMGGIDLDPASCDTAQRTVRATTYYTAETDGLAQQWRGRAWMNPPYSGGAVTPFIDKILQSYAAGEVTGAVVLVNNATDTRWGQALIGASAAVCFHSGRIRFVKERGDFGVGLQGQMFAYLGGDVAAFRSQFERFGVVL